MSEASDRLKHAAYIGSRSADNDNYQCGVTIREANEAAAEIDRLESLTTRQAEQIKALREALGPVIAAIRHTDSSVLVDDNWNPDAHVEIVLTVSECQAVYSVHNTAIAALAGEEKNDA